MRSFALLVVLLAGGCDLYFTDGDDTCGPIAEPAFVPDELRDPSTGICTNFSTGCDARCDPSCVPTAETADLARPDWGSCWSKCEGLGASACMAEPGCFAAFFETTGAPEFRGCWETAPSGPVGGSCANLDAQQCSRHDDCVAYYEGPTYARTSPVRPTFLSCGPEPVGASCEATTCGPGSHCEQTCDDQGACEAACVPDVNVCAGVDCGPGWACSEVCSGGTCGAHCVPAGTCEAIGTENACKTRPDCTAVYLGEDCTCYPNAGCTCEILTYDRCETK